MSVSFKEVKIGDSLPVLQIEPINRTILALYAGGSGDHTPYHIDIDYAKAAGFDDVIAHGMLSMAYLGRLLTQWVLQSQIRTFEARFLTITPVHVALTCTGEVVEKFVVENENRVRVSLAAHDQAGNVTLAGAAVVGLLD